MKKNHLCSFIVAMAAISPFSTIAAECIQKSDRYPQYWEYSGEPVLLLGGSVEDNERFCRNVFGGMASARFHRSDSGLGLNLIAQAGIQSMRLVTDAIDLVACAPHDALLGEREKNEAYCFANPGTEAAVFFPDGGSVTLDVSKFDEDETVEVRWLPILDSEWKPMRSIPLEPVHPHLALTAPGKGYWVFLVQGRD